MPFFVVLSFVFPIKSGDLFQDKLLNLKWETVLDPSRNKATQTSSLPQHDKESGKIVGTLLYFIHKSSSKKGIF